MSNAIRQFVHHADWFLTGAALLIIAIGLIAVWSFAPSSSGMFLRQVLWVALGLAAFFLFSLFDYRIFRNHGLMLVMLYIAVAVFLAALFVLAPVTRGVRSWFYIGGAGVQPVEVMKVVLVIVLAKYFSRRHIEIARIRHLFISGVYAGTAVLLVFLQPDLGSAVILMVIWLAMVIFSGIRIRHLAMVALVGALAAAVAWFYLLAPYQKVRITSFLDPYRDSRGAGYNAIQAMIAAGSGRVWGKGIGYGTQSHLNFLPVSESDFIFAAFVEETGFIGAVVLLGLYGVFFWRVVRIGARAQDNFAKLFVLGFSAFLFSEMFIHIAINIGLLPITGLGLPLISYGGSSMIATLAGLGIVQSIRINSVMEIR